jgi:hypothetical protein
LIELPGKNQQQGQPLYVQLQEYKLITRTVFPQVGLLTGALIEGISSQRFYTKVIKDLTMQPPIKKAPEQGPLFTKMHVSVHNWVFVV